MNIKLALTALLLILPATLPATAETVDPEAAKMDVYKSPTCGCCKKWISHIEKAGFAVKPVDHSDLYTLKMNAGIQPEYQSCHTGIIDGYVFEGHVPAKFIEQFLEQPVENAIGLSVPAMPVGTPGMEMGDRFMPYDVLVLMKDGSDRVYASIKDYNEQF